MADDEEPQAVADTRTPEEIEAEDRLMIEFYEGPAKKTDAELDAEAFEEFERDLEAAGMTYEQYLNGGKAE